MPVADLLTEGVKLMLLGMGTVFVFLLLLVVAMTGMSRLARVLGSQETPAVASMHTAAPPGSQEDRELLAVIGAAIRRYRATHR